MKNSKNKIQVLIVEDDAKYRYYLKDIIESEGHKCYTAENGVDGLEKFNTYQPKLIISDIQMPKMNGLELLEAVRATGSNSIFIMMTVFDSEQYAIKALKLGANNYLKKPVRLAELIMMIRKYSSIFIRKNTEQNISKLILEREFKMQFISDINIIPNIVDRLLKETENSFDDVQRIGIEIGLQELLVNAIEHGNLEISFDEKKTALEAGELDQLHKERLKNQTFSKRFNCVHMDDNR